ncbi:TPA: hypothetical protein ACMZ3V_000926 [Neisseria gonorrhoeae]
MSAPKKLPAFSQPASKAAHSAAKAKYWYFLNTFCPLSDAGTGFNAV